MARNFTRDNDAGELDILRAGVNCAIVLERAGYGLDKTESTPRHQKYRHDGGNIVIVTHDGRGWWDPHSSGKGDVFNLVQHLNAGMSLGQVRQHLRPLVGIAPTAPPAAPRPTKQPDVPVDEQWANRPNVREGSPVWRYLTQERALPAFVVRAAIAEDALREGIRGTAWFAHRDADGRLLGADRRGPDYRGFTTGGDKALFQFRMDATPVERLVVAESPIDAMSFAALDRRRAGTLYTATSGGMGDGTVEALNGLLARVSSRTNGRLVTATDADEAGHRYDNQIRALAGLHDVMAGRVLPFAGLKDWNEVLQRGAAIPVPVQANATPSSSGYVPDNTHTPVRDQLQRFRDARAAAAATDLPAAVAAVPVTAAAPASRSAGHDPRP